MRPGKSELDSALAEQMRCPICQQDNQCEIARTGGVDVRRWCLDTPIPADLRREATALGKVCVCRNCASRA
jgi:hypothetical protein